MGQVFASFEEACKSIVGQIGATIYRKRIINGRPESEIAHWHPWREKIRPGLGADPQERTVIDEINSTLPESDKKRGYYESFRVK